MSSIAYVTDEKMLEYHRLCANKQMLFWRLPTNRKFSDFQKGDYLFFYAKTQFSSRKGLVGYAHYDSSMKLSTSQMWKKYQNLTGYDSKEKLEETIIKASRTHELPKKVSCLFLKNVVFFMTPVYPKEVGLKIPSNLESYQYLDRDDPEITVNILKKAEEHGIDVWSSDPNVDPDIIFHRDELRQQVAMVAKKTGPFHFKEKEKTKSSRLVKTKLEEKGWEIVRGSDTDCLKIGKKDIIIALPFVTNPHDEKQRTQEFIGRAVLYKIGLKNIGITKRISFEVMCEEPCDELKKAMIEAVLHE